MNKILKYKKTIIVSAILIATLIVGLCLLSFNGRKITVDNNNPNYCYNLSKIPAGGDISGIDNALKVSEYIGEFNSSTVKFIAPDVEEEEDEYAMDEDFFSTVENIGWGVNGESNFTRIDVYLLHNLVGDVPIEWVPKVRYNVTDKVMKIEVDKTTISYIHERGTDKRVNLNLLIVVS